MTSMHDADAVPAASPSRQVSRGTMVWAVGRRDNCTGSRSENLAAQGRRAANGKFRK